MLVDSFFIINKLQVHKIMGFGKFLKSVGKVFTAPASLLVSGVGAAANLISGNQTNKANIQMNRENNAAQMELAKYQADRNLELWNLNNEYNSPVKQMERYREAGLNPNLIYGSGSASAGNASAPAAGMSLPTTRPGHVENYMPNITQLLMNGLTQSANIQKTNSETAVNYQNLANLEEDNKIKKLLIIQQQYQNSKSHVEAKYWEDRLMAEMVNLDSGSQLRRAQALLADSNRFSIDALRPLQVAETKQRVAKLLAETTGVEQENSFRVRLASAKIANLYMDAAYKRSSKGYTDNLMNGQALKNKVQRILLDSGLDLSGDAIDRLLYNIGSDGWLSGAVKTGAGVASIVGRALHD